MSTQPTNETATLENVATNASPNEATSILTNDIYAREAGDTCEANQEGHEWSAGAGHPILKCTEVSIGTFRWKDTGRVRS